MENADNIFIEGLEEACRIGTTPEERSLPQPITVSLFLYLPLDVVAKFDDLTKSVDYAAVASRTRALLLSREFNLVETVAEEISRLALEYSAVNSVRVRVSKKVLPGIHSVGAEVLRDRKQK